MLMMDFKDVKALWRKKPGVNVEKKSFSQNWRVNVCPMLYDSLVPPSAVICFFSPNEMTWAGKNEEVCCWQKQKLKTCL